MKSLDVTIANAGLAQERLDALAQRLVPELDQIRTNIRGERYATPYAFAQVPDDKELVARVTELVRKKKNMQPAMLIVVGIGGSNFGTQAIQQLVLGTLYNDMQQAMPVYYADTTDSDYMQSLLTLARTALQAGKEIVINVVSKSGKTTETIANFELFLALLKQERPTSYADALVVTTDEGSLLWQLATVNGWDLLAVPKLLGGRYSVFSAVGLFPLGMLGIVLDDVLQGARAMRDRCIAAHDNPAVQLAAWQVALIDYDANVQNMFLFGHDLFSFGGWWRQLNAESLAKAQMRTGQRNTKAFLPITSLGSVDLHSIGQLFLADVLPIATSFVSVAQSHATLTLPAYSSFDALVPHMQNKRLDVIDQALLMGVQRAYKERGLPFVSITLPEKTAYAAGQLLQLYMHQVVYIAALLAVNPFDQPEVERYKEQTRRILAHE